MARPTKLYRVFNRIELNYTNLTNQIFNWLSSAYEKSGILFNSASPYGQILEVVKEFFLQNILYLKNFVKQLDIEQANSRRMVNSIARISGHNPSRTISAKGTLKFKLKQGVDIYQNVPNAKVIIYDGTVIKNRTNSLYYTLKTNNVNNIYTLLPGCQFFVNVIQGKYEIQAFTGDGTINQSLQVNVSNNVTIDNFDFQVTLNSVNLQIKDHLYDMLENEYACYTRTGFNGGLDVYFGNGINGVVPPLGSIIEVKYLLNNGLSGNIVNNKVNDFTFIDDIYDDLGNAVQASNLFDIYIETNIQFASNGESVEYTKSVIPYVSRNFVLATPNQFIYHLKKLNMFSKVNAFNTLDMVKIDIDSDGSKDQININEMYLYLIPRISDYFSNNINYFNVSLDAFDLQENEKNRIITYLKMQGIVSITANIKVINPVRKFFVANVFIRRFDDVSEDNIREQVISVLATYFSNYDRYDRVIKADIIARLKFIDGIDSVNIEFVGKDNEDYHRDGALLSSNTRNVIESTYVASSNSVTINSDVLMSATGGTLDVRGVINSSSPEKTFENSTIVSYKRNVAYDAKKMVGIDPILGDIVVGKNELVILRGGWKNRNDVYFSEDPRNTTGFSSVNIIWKGTTDHQKAAK